MLTLTFLRSCLASLQKEDSNSKEVQLLNSRLCRPDGLGEDGVTGGARTRGALSPGQKRE